MNAESAKSPRLGRGLSALFGEYQIEGNPGAEPELPADPGPRQNIPIDVIRANPGQPRRSFDPADMAELVESVRARGVLQPILLRPDQGQPGRYEIVAGERRWRAAQGAGLDAIPAVIRDDLSDLDVLEIAIIENVQRKDLNPIEEALAYRQLAQRFNHTHAAIADAVGKSREHVSNLLRLLTLPEDVLDHVRDGVLSAGHARALLGTSDPSALASEIIAKGLSVRDVEKLAQGTKAGEIVRAVAALNGADRAADTRALEADLMNALGLKLEIRERGPGAGEIRIQYKKLEQLDEVCRRLSSRL